MTQEYLPFSPPRISEAGIALLERTVRSGWLGTGPLTQDFEVKFAALKGVSHANAVSSCTSGIFLALKVLNIGPGDEVITTNMTFVSTVNAILHCGATPVLLDVDDVAGNISVERLEEAISPRTKAILPVHYAGFPVRMKEIVDLAKRYDVRVIEDCAHAVETISDGQHAGTFGDIGVFSFYATKNIAVGEGGMVITDDPHLSQRLATLSLHGLSRGAWQRFSASGRRTYDVLEVGYKANFTDVQSAIALSQLDELAENSVRRTEIWDYYLNELSETPLIMPNLPSGDQDFHARHLFVAKLPPSIDRDFLVEKMGDRYKLAFGVHYRAVSQFEIYSDLARFDPNGLEVSEKWGSQCISLSLSPGMTDLHVERVVNALKTELL